MPESQGQGVLTLPHPDKSATDKKDYRAIQLENGLRVLLISDRAYPLSKLDEEEEEDDDEDDEDSMDDDDEESDEEESDEEMEEEEEECGGKKKSASGLKNSAAALCVGVGSFSDPASVPGMAHFLEHMVFMGSDKYPDENAFDEFVSKCGGFDNAHTDCETTSFYFDIQRKHFKEALDRLANFFVSPLMKQSAMQREREAVDSEFEQALTSDSNRMEQLFGSLAKQGHPMSKFMWGNLQSLQPKNVRENMVFFLCFMLMLTIDNQGLRGGDEQESARVQASPLHRAKHDPVRAESTRVG